MFPLVIAALVAGTQPLPLKGAGDMTCSATMAGDSTANYFCIPNGKTGRIEVHCRMPVGGSGRQITDGDHWTSDGVMPRTGKIKFSEPVSGVGGRCFISTKTR